MQILIACEESQAVCKAFRELGHEAYSCDIQPCSGGHPEWHIQGDALKSIRGGQLTTMDGQTHSCKWDMLIAHPPCTYLSNVATRSFSLRCTPAEKVVARWEQRAKSAVFFMHFALADIPRIAVENPVGFMNVASDIWSALRYELGPKDLYCTTPFQMSTEPLPIIYTLDYDPDENLCELEEENLE